jgi:NADPH:quinone reductase-like Zn-dependent oxidoreductase
MPTMKAAVIRAAGADRVGLAVQIAPPRKKGDRLLIRGGTTSVGLAAAAIAKRHGVYVAATKRSPSRDALLRANGADHVFIDTGSVADQIKAASAERFDKVLELVGTTTLLDSLQCAGRGGIVCMTGIVGNAWQLDGFAPMDAIPTTVNLTSARRLAKRRARVCLGTKKNGVETEISKPLFHFLFLRCGWHESNPPAWLPTPRRVVVHDGGHRPTCRRAPVECSGESGPWR